MKNASLTKLVSAPALWGGVLLAAAIFWASFHNLANYPELWWDEGIFSETAANLVQHGRYAFTEESPDQLSDLDYRISAGPAIILPVALSYRLLGVGVLQGRLVAACYLVFAFLTLFLASRRLFGAQAAGLAVILALLGTDVIHWGRPVLGDVPALGLFLGGVWLIIRSLEEGTLWPLFLGGLFFGLAFDAKEFYGMAFLPPLAALARRDWGAWGLMTRKVLLFILGVSLPLLAYLAFKMAVLGGLQPAVMHFMTQKALLRHEFFTPLTIGRVYGESFRYLCTHPLYVAGLLGWLWLWRTGELTLGRSLWLWNFILWSLMYLTAIFWYRFALPALFLAAPPAAVLLCRLWDRLTLSGARFPLKLAAAGLLAGFALWFFPGPGLKCMHNACEHQGQPPSHLVDYLRERVPRHSLIETPEYELAFLDDFHRFHLMPAYFFMESDEHGVKLLNPRPDSYNFNQVKADFLVLGYFGKSIFAQVYPPAVVARYWQKVAQLDYYDVYVRRSSALLKADGPAKLSTSPSVPIIKARGNKVHGPRSKHPPFSH
jgi:hypothetical protein